MTEPANHVGCVGFGPHQSPARVFQRLSAVELQQSFVYPPRAATLRRWREQARPGFGFMVRVFQLVTHEPGAPTYKQLPKNFKGDVQHAGHFRDSDAVRQAMSRTLEVARALDAPALVFETPVSFTPSRQHRSAMSHFFERCQREERLMVWRARGVWRPEEMVALCRDLQLVPCWEPFASPDGPVMDGRPAPRDLPGVYYRLEGLGTERSYDELQLEWLADQLQQVPGASCIFSSPLHQSQAERVQELLTTP